MTHSPVKIAASTVALNRASYCSGFGFIMSNVYVQYLLATKCYLNFELSLEDSLQNGLDRILE